MNHIEIDRSKIVQLTPMELEVGAMVGMHRQMESVLAGRANQHGYKGEHEWEINIQGALAELAFSKYANWYWAAPVNTFSAPDCGKNVQVRWRSQFDWDLIIRPKDDDEQIYVLVVGTAPTFKVCGWIRGRDGKKKEYEKCHGGRPPAYFVPQSALNQEFPKS
jgi:hypothetical protein